MALNFSRNPYIGAFAIESVFPRRIRSKLITLLGVVTILLALITIILPGLLSLAVLVLPAQVVSSLSILSVINLRIPFGILVFLLPFLFVSEAFEAFCNAKTFEKHGAIVGENIAERFNVYASELWWHGPRFSRSATTQSLFSAFKHSDIGRMFLLRLGIGTDALGEFIEKTQNWTPIDAFTDTVLAKTPAGSDIALPLVTRLLFETNVGAKSFLDARDISLSDVEQTAKWLEHSSIKIDTARRWWLPENLARIPGVGKEWSYSQTPLLDQFGHDMEHEASRASRVELIGKDREIKLLESALLEESGANAIIVGEIGSGRHTVLNGLAHMIIEGTIFPDLENKRVFRLEGPSLVASGKTKGEIEASLIRILNEAAAAANIILAIDEFPEFVESLGKVGVNAGEILTNYLAHPSLHIIAIADTVGFRRAVENNAGLMKYFERIEILEPDLDRLLEILEDHAPETEALRGVIFTYNAIETIGRGGMERLVAGALPERAIDLLEEVGEAAQQQGKTLIMSDLVSELITQKTKIPMGEIKKDEQDKLEHLESFLQKRVIGQDEAVKAVADAVRRARSGIGNPKRPIGTFLFLGPTGVGKTETAKALAESYFGSEEAMLRFDMTEYQTEEGFDKLVGSNESKEPGLLTSRMHAAPYALVLLDEFEKSNSKVKNLFLQVLDEGFFSDALGRKVNMRNTIIIATSNAGAKLIWESVEKGTDPATLRNELFTYIQKEGLYSPELLNRFDAVIIYHPLSKEVLTKIARIHLEKFAARLASSKNMKLTITDELAAATAKGGFDPVFGARPMQRFIQDKVEKVVADKIIRGDVQSGSAFSLTPEELATIV